MEKTSVKPSPIFSRRTRVDLRIDLKGLISSVDGTVPVERLAEGQRAVHVAILLILVIPQRDVVKISILETHLRIQEFSSVCVCVFLLHTTRPINIPQ